MRTYKATRMLCRHKLAREMPAELKSSLQAFLVKNVPGYRTPDDGGEEKNARHDQESDREAARGVLGIDADGVIPVGQGNAVLVLAVPLESTKTDAPLDRLD